MLVPIEQFAGIESGPAVILGNGPSLNNYKDRQFACPIIGINSSTSYWPDQDYYVTVAYARLAEVASGEVTARKAVFTCLQKRHAVPDSIPTWSNSCVERMR